MGIDMSSNPDIYQHSSRYRTGRFGMEFPLSDTLLPPPAYSEHPVKATSKYVDDFVKARLQCFLSYFFDVDYNMAEPDSLTRGEGNYWRMVRYCVIRLQSGPRALAKYAIGTPQELRRRKHLDEVQAYVDMAVVEPALALGVTPSVVFQALLDFPFRGPRHVSVDYRSSECAMWFEARCNEESGPVAEMLHQRWKADHITAFREKWCALWRVIKVHLMTQQSLDLP